MMKLLLLGCLLCSNALFAEGAKELLRNGDFESTGDWSCARCKVELNSDRVHGSHSFKITNRDRNWSGLRQTVSVTSGHRYVTQCYIKLLSMVSGHAYTGVELLAFVHTNHGNRFHQLAFHPMQQLKFGWTKIAGDFIADPGATSVEVYTQMDPSLEFLIDDCTFQELPDDPSWKTEAQSSINKIRKAPVTINIATSSHSQGKYSVELIQEKRKFGWGAAIRANMIKGGTSNFEHFFYNNFEWTTFVYSMKWPEVEPQKGHEVYWWANKVNILKSHGIKVRGHNMFWADDGHVPGWVKGLYGRNLTTEMLHHVSSMVSHTKGKLEHWDVNNENLHGDFYERHTSNPDITGLMFRWIHELEPGVKLFLNDYNVAVKSQYMSAFRKQALELKKEGAPIGALGVQGHFHGSDIDIIGLKHRLDLLAETGLPIWITELTIEDRDENKKAAALENVLTLFFSHPAVEGVIFWGFWDAIMPKPQAAITTGSDVHPNAAGRVYQRLYNTDWKTHLTHTITPSHPVSTPAFMGDYLLNVKLNNHVIHQERFTLDTTGKNLTIHLQDSQHVSHIAFG